MSLDTTDGVTWYSPVALFSRLEVALGPERGCYPILKQAYHSRWWSDLPAGMNHCSFQNVPLSNCILLSTLAMPLFPDSRMVPFNIEVW